MFNRIILMGRLTKDPEIRTTQSGVTMCRFSIAVDRAYSKGQEKQTDFFDITAWRQTAEFVSKYFSKGKCILIEGKIQNNNYTDQNGVKQYDNTAVLRKYSVVPGTEGDDADIYTYSGTLKANGEITTGTVTTSDNYQTITFTADSST